MMWHVIPQSFDNGPLGLAIEAETPEAAAALALAGPYAAHAGQTLVVRWDVRHDADGDVLFARVVEITPVAPAPVVVAPIVTAPVATAEPKVTVPTLPGPAAVA